MWSCFSRRIAVQRWITRSRAHATKLRGRSQRAENQPRAPAARPTAVRRLRNERNDQRTVGRRRCGPREVRCQVAQLQARPGRSEILERPGRQTLSPRIITLNTDPQEREDVPHECGSRPPHANATCSSPQAGRTALADRIRAAPSSSRPQLRLSRPLVTRRYVNHPPPWTPFADRGRRPYSPPAAAARRLRIRLRSTISASNSRPESITAVISACAAGETTPSISASRNTPNRCGG